MEVRMTRTILKAALSTLALAAALPALAQDAMPEMTPEQKAMMEAFVAAGTPGDPHAALARMAGTYDMTIRSWEAPGAPPTVEQGTATRTMILGGRVMVEDAQSTMHGQPFTGQGLHGYDNVSGKHWATWTDTMSTGLMVSTGSCDAAGTCTFTGTWNDPVTKGPVTARMTSRWTAPDTEVFEMFAPGPDGKEMQMMEITYRKRAP
jgi:hypothetical protein